MGDGQSGHDGGNDKIASFNKAKEGLQPEHKRMVEKTDKVRQQHGPRAAIRQTLRNTHDMVNAIEDAVNDAPNEAALRAAIDTGIKNFEDGLNFLKEHKEALLSK